MDGGRVDRIPMSRELESGEAPSWSRKTRLAQLGADKRSEIPIKAALNRFVGRARIIEWIVLFKLQLSSFYTGNRVGS